MKREAQIEQAARVISSLVAQWRHGRTTEGDFELAIRHALSIFHDDLIESLDLNPEGQRAGEEWRARELAIAELVDGMKRLRQWLAEAIFHLLRAYEAGHRKGWEPGPSSTETLTLIHTWLADKGFDPNERHTPQFVGAILSALGGDQTLAAVEKARQP